MILACVLIAFTVGNVLDKFRVHASDTASVVLQNHPRIKENCVEDFEGAEGAHIEGFYMQKVFIVTTSGLRTPHVHNGRPLLRDPDNHLHFCSFKKMHKYVDIGSYSDTLTVKDKFRNKKITPAFKNLEPLPNMKHCGSQSLSSFGVLQLINLGKYLFKSYFGKLKSLDTNFLTRKFASTFGDQTLFQSVSALLYGLLNEKQFVYTDVAKLSSDFSAGPSTGPAAVSSTGPSTVSQSTEAQLNLHYFVEQSFIKENHFFKDTKVFAFSRRDISDMLFGADVSSKDIISYLSNSLCPIFPNQGNTINLSYDDVSHIFNLSDSYNNYLTTSSLFWSYSTYRTGPLRKLMKDWLSPDGIPYRQQTGNRNSIDDLKIITVDDLLMFSFLRSLNVPVLKHISPASRLVVERCVLQDSVSDSVNLILEQPGENISSMKQVKIDTRTKKSLSESLRNQFTLLSKDNSPEKKAFIGVLKTENLSLEKVGQSDLSLLSPNKIGDFEVYTEDKKSDNFKLPNKQSLHTYIRLLYNGEVITSFIPGCDGDQMISLGMCSYETFEYFLSSFQRQHYPVREEL